MKCISRKEQQRIVGKIQEDFDCLVKRERQQIITPAYAITQAETLLKEIKNINRSRFFEEDLQEILDEYFMKITGYIQENLTFYISLS